MKPFSAALMPLTSHVLPGGRMALRIFEPRYIRMVKEAMQGLRPFIICMVNSEGQKIDNQHIHPIGCQVEIVDFDQGSDGLLGITIAGVRLVAISSIDTEKDELRKGSCVALDVTQKEDICVQHIGGKLKTVFEAYPELAQLYDYKDFQDPLWVVMRWLELIPISSADKQSMLNKADVNQVASYLNQLIE